jgi:predicted RNase H-like HicB family nuclease
MKYVYPAIFTEEEKGGYSVYFPDFDSCYTDGNTVQDALERANDVLCLTLYDMEKAGETPPSPSNLKEAATGANEFATLVSCDTDWYRKYYGGVDNPHVGTAYHGTQYL